MDNSLNDLVTLTDAVFQAEMQKMSIVNAQEAEIRKKLSELDDHRQKNQSLPGSEFHGIREIGADVLWNAWVSRTRQELMLQLAQILAQKARMRSKLQTAFGKKEASSELLGQASHEQEAKTRCDWLNETENLQIVKAHTPPK